jgi:hypothetical protein
MRFHDRHRLEPDFAVGHHPQSLRARTRLGQSISIKELPTRIVTIDLSNEDESTSNRRVECIRCALGDLVELRPEPKNPDGENAIASGRTGACSWATIISLHNPRGHSAFLAGSVISRLCWPSAA